MAHYLPLPYLLSPISSPLLEREIDGDEFLRLNREDFNILFPSKEKFLVGSRLYRLAQQLKCGGSRQRNTQSLINELSYMEGSDILTDSPRSSSTPDSSRLSTPVSRKHSLHELNPPVKKKCVETNVFKLPAFSPQVSECIRSDSFYTSAQRNRIIKEGCSALRGFCWGEETTVSNDKKRLLAKKLYELAPKSLGDSGNENPEVSMCESVMYM